MAGNATAVQPVIHDDDAARKVIVLRVLLERLVDELSHLDMLANDASVDLAVLKEGISDATMLACVALDEVSPLERR